MDSVFIAYRRSGGAEAARIVRHALQRMSLNVFLDVESLADGRFDQAIEHQIYTASDVIVILSPGALDKAIEQEDDWLRREIALAIRYTRNIIPVLLPGFSWPPVELPTEISTVRNYNAISWSHEYLDAALEKLRAFIRAAPSATPLPSRRGSSVTRLLVSFLLGLGLAGSGLLLWPETAPIPAEALSKALKMDPVSVKLSSAANALQRVDRFVAAYRDSASGASILLATVRNGPAQPFTLPLLADLVRRAKSNAGLPPGCTFARHVNRSGAEDANEIEVEYFGETEGTLLGLVLFDADRVLKELQSAIDYLGLRLPRQSKAIALSLRGWMKTMESALSVKMCLLASGGTRRQQFMFHLLTDLRSYRSMG